MTFFDKRRDDPASGTEMVFTVRVHPGEEDEGGYWAEVLDLEGCVSQGETLDELTENIREAILSWIAAHDEDEGHHSPRPGMIMNVPVLVPN